MVRSKPKTQRRLRLAWVVSIILGHGGCVHSPEHEPLPPIHLPDAYATSKAGAKTPDKWWRSFRDTRLNALVRSALEDNFQMRSAWDRLAQAEALAYKAGAPLWPGFRVDGSYVRTRTIARSPIPGRNSFSIDGSQYGLSLGASYELDVWGKARSQRAAAWLEHAATEADVAGMAMTLAAQVSETWFSWVTFGSQQSLVQQQLETNETFLELTELRYAQGLTSALDVYQQKQQVSGSKAQLALLKGQRDVARQQLSVLVGKAPGEIPADDVAPLPELPPLPRAGVPADLLLRRPDVRAARLRVEAADYQVGVALADMFPSLTLSASIGYQAFELASLFKDIIWNLIASVTQPIFEGGRRYQEKKRAEAALRERINVFAKTVLDAMLEVESSLVQEEQQVRHIEHLETQLAHADAALREAQSQYNEGLVDFLRVLSALQAKQRTEFGILSARRQLFSYRIQLCRALGGTWTDELEPYPSEEKESKKKAST